jgi:hypothetical protein
MSENRTNRLARGYRVYVDDNYHFSDEDERYHLGDFATYDEAVAAAKKVVEGFFQAELAGRPEDELFKGYMGHGEDSWITPIGGATEAIARFSAREYAKELSQRLSQLPSPPNSSA